MQSVHTEFHPTERAPLAFSTFWMQPIHISIFIKRGCNMSSELLAALIGALIGGLLTLLANWFSHSLQCQAADRAEDSLINGFIWSIHTEVTAIHHRYMETFGETVRESLDNTALNYHYLIQEDYFTIFNNNSELIGRIKDKALRDKIINTYSFTKGMVDTFRQNGIIVKRLEELKISLASQSPHPHTNDLKTAFEASLCEYGNQIRAGHNILIDNFNSLIQHIEETTPER
jgi:hypothetical protein